MRLIVIFVLIFTATGCSKTPDKAQLKDWVQENVNVCKATVGDIIIVKEGLLSNKYVGFATVTLDKKTLYPEITVYSDPDGNSFQQMSTNPCEVFLRNIY